MSLGSASSWAPRKNGSPPIASPIYKELSEKYGALVPHILWARDGLGTQGEIEKHLNPRLESLENPFSIKNLEASAERLADAVVGKQKIAIYADYDMDGMSGLSILVSFFESLGVDSIEHIQPHRFKDGYGVHPHLIETLKDRGVDVIVTVDTGSMAFDADLKAAELGMGYIITDHHQCDPERSPTTAFFINPNQAGDTSKLKYLSGAGVAFYLAMGVRAKLRQRSYFESRSMAESNLLELLDLFSLGSIGDVVPLNGDNRILVRYGLDRLRNTKRPGLKLLLDTFLEGKAKIGARDVAFSIVPKLNSASRMGQAELSTKLLLEKDFARAQELFSQISGLNTERSRLQKQAVLEAKAQAQGLKDRGDRVLVVCGDWHEGILGIVAAKIAEDFHLPAIVLAPTHDLSGLPILRGSMRCPAPHHSLRILENAKKQLMKYGGHQAAAGLSLKAVDFEELQQALQSPVSGENLNLPTARHQYDGELENLPKLFDVKSLDSFEPFGAGNPEPVFLLRNFSIGTFEILKDAHIKARKSGVELIGFNLYNKLQESAALDSKVDLLVVPEISTFRFQEKVQLRIQALRPSNHLEILADRSEELQPFSAVL